MHPRPLAIKKIPGSFLRKRVQLRFLQEDQKLSLAVEKRFHWHHSIALLKLYIYILVIAIFIIAVCLQPNIKKEMSTFSRHPVATFFVLALSP